MTKHILLLFLSDVKTKIENGRVAISQAVYNNIGMDGETDTTNESAIKYLLNSQWQGNSVDKIDRLFIFASKKVRCHFVSANDHGEKKLYEDGNGKNYTHLEFFKNSLLQKNIIDNLAESLPDENVYPFEENAPVDKTMEMVAEMADMIQHYVQQQGIDNVVVHVDLTGGMRYVNMMMLELMRLMEYNGITIGKVLYSDYKRPSSEPKVSAGSEDASMVREIKNIYEIFNLISGAEEFVNSGRVSVISGYFEEKEKSPELKELLAAMICFAEEIQLCHRGNFSAAVERLQSAKTAFQDVQSPFVGDVLMRQIMPRIEREYNELLADRQDELSSIQWCLSHEYLQQALTLYIETIPRYLFIQHVVKFTDVGQTEVRARKHDEVSDEFYALNRYAVADNDNIVNKKLKQYQKNFKQEYLYTGIQNICKGKCSPNQALQDIREILNSNPALYFTEEERLQTGIQCISELTDNPGKVYFEREPWYQLLWREYRKSKNVVPMDEWDILSQESKVKNLQVFLMDSLSESAAVHLFGTLAFDYSFKVQLLMQEGKLQSLVPTNVFYRIMNQYGTIKSERNLSNHAKTMKSNFTVQGLKQYMNDGLEELRALCRQHD